MKILLRLPSLYKLDIDLRAQHISIFPSPNTYMCRGLLASSQVSIVTRDQFYLKGKTSLFSQGKHPPPLPGIYNTLRGAYSPELC